MMLIIFLSELSEMDVSSAESDVPVLLVYYNYHGIGHMVRYLLCYLNIPFLDIMLDEYETQRNTLPAKVLQVLRSKTINKNDLPAIIHDNHIIYELNQVMTYLCIVFRREDLLGVDIRQKARVCEVQELYSLRLTANIRFLSGFVAEIHKTHLQGQELLEFVEEKLQCCFKESGYFKQLATYLLIQNKQQFVFTNITVIDFYFIETCRFSVGLYSNIDEQLANSGWTETARKFRIAREAMGRPLRNIRHLRAMKTFIDFMTSQPFYQRSKAYLQGFKLFPKAMSGEQSQGMRKLQANYFPDLYYDSNA